MNYWDTSALAKLYVSEPDSAQFAAHLASTGPATASDLVRWEMFRVLARKESEGLIPPGAADLIFNKFVADVASGAVALIAMGPSVEDRFRQVVLQLLRRSSPILTRTLDAIHLATADLHNAAEFVATDTHLRKCAAALEFNIYP